MFDKLPNSTRRFIRSEKARIRRQFLDYKQQEVAITDMYNKILNKPVVKKLEETEPIKLEKASPNQQKNETTQKLKTKSQSVKSGKKTKAHKNKKVKK
ncbi:MAG: hypothetical protein Q7S77_00690 [Candidatus Staskawiczbacteria bacterium]|nr:hypothetical protein [Candidatus Staskawiczbacteria bacterium]